MAAFCFCVVDRTLSAESSKNTQQLQPSFQSPFSSTSCALFVSFKITRNHELRGCIGTFSEAPLGEQLCRYAKSAAFEDGRFQPITARELQTLSCSVTLLSNFEPAAHCYDWVIGTHGVRIKVLVKGTALTATFLPQVMIEQGWDHKKTIEQLLRKSGYKGSITEEVLRSIQTERYLGSVCEVSYADYKKLYAN